MHCPWIVPALIVGAAMTPARAADPPKPNVLFLAVDDLRPQIGCYGTPGIVSPNLDRLAAGGVRFDRAYCNVPVCGASRASLMTSIRPSPNRFRNHLSRADQDAPGITTLNTHFRSHGYHTISNGKVFHVPADNASGWSEKPWRPQAPTYLDPASLKLAAEHAKEDEGGRGPAYESADVPDDSYADGQIAAKAIDDLRRLKTMDTPFFLAVGFMKPHLPFIAPKKYWDLYDPARIALPETYHRPQDAPDQAMHNWGELRNYAEIPAKGLVSDQMALTLIRGYDACVSYTDAQIGRVLDELDRLGLADNTIVILWGDHGWNLGDHTLWCKHCCFETAMRTPLIVRAPGISGGTSVAGLTEYLDIYPTLCELAGLPLPTHLEGRSFVDRLRDPNAPGNPDAIGRFGDGDTIRTEQHRFTEYSDKAGKVVARMLYDHRSDPAEDVNIAERPESAEIVRDLAARLRARKGRD